MTIEQILKTWLLPLSDELPPLYMVGGVVRDHLLSRPVKDIDLMCRDAETFARQVAKARNAVVVPFEKKADEPCYRVVMPQSQEMFLDIAAMRGETVYEDLARRDFTINAIAIRIESGGKFGEITDPLNGKHDLAHQIIRLAGPRAFESDPLRILRAVRFAAELGFAIEKNTRNAMQENAPAIERVAFERISAELLKIFNTANTSSFVRLMDQLEILAVIFPEIITMKACPQNAYHHLDVWHHSLAVLENCEYILNHLEMFFNDTSTRIKENLKLHNRLAILKLAALLHDVGKPLTRGFREDTGRITFYGHAEKGRDIAEHIANRMRLSNRDQEFMQMLIAEHLHILNLSQPGVKSVTRLKLFRKLKDDVIPLLILGMSDIKGTMGPEATEEFRTRHLQWSVKMAHKYYEDIKPRMERPNLITGDDLIAMGMTPGPEFGKIIKTVREVQDAGLIKDREEALAMMNELLVH